jgi:hypothetical protein
VRATISRLIDWIPIVIALIAVCGLLDLAYGAPQQPTTQPATTEQIAQWATDLAADDYATRSLATQKLSQAGPAAADALKKASSDADPERALRAAALLARLNGTTPLLDAEMRKVFETISLPRSPRIQSARVTDGPACEMTVQGCNERVVMRCDGKEITIRAEHGGQTKKSSKELHARDAADLKHRYPDAWAFYRWTTANLGGDDGAAMRKWFEQFQNTER